MESDLEGATDLNEGQDGLDGVHVAQGVVCVDIGGHGVQDNNRGGRLSRNLSKIEKRDERDEERERHLQKVFNVPLASISHNDI